MFSYCMENGVLTKKHFSKPRLWMAEDKGGHGDLPVSAGSKGCPTTTLGPRGAGERVASPVGTHNNPATTLGNRRKLPPSEKIMFHSPYVSPAFPHNSFPARHSASFRPVYPSSVLSDKTCATTCRQARRAP